MTEPWRIALKDEMIKKSTLTGKKLFVEWAGKTIHFGARGYEQFYDETGIWKDDNHLDEDRRDRYIARHEKIRLKDGSKAIENPLSPSYWSLWILWNPERKGKKGGEYKGFGFSDLCDMAWLVG